MKTKDLCRKSDRLLDPELIEQEIARQQAALTEELAQNLPDEYLSPEELREREERKPPHRWEEE